MCVCRLYIDGFPNGCVFLFFALVLVVTQPVSHDVLGNWTMWVVLRAFFHVMDDGYIDSLEGGF